MIGYFKHGAKWRIGRVDMADVLAWWCGKFEWCEPGSSFWNDVAECRPVEFDSLGKARLFSKRRGWE